MVAPRDGVVIALAAADGMFLQPGAQAMSITDLDKVWLIVDVFERDIARFDGRHACGRPLRTSAGTDIRRPDRLHLPGTGSKNANPACQAPVRQRRRSVAAEHVRNVRLFPNETRTAVTIPSEAVIRTGTAERVVIKVGEALSSQG